MKLLEDFLKGLSLPGDPQTLERFGHYRSRILEWNESVNLTAVKKEEEFEVKHFLDSLMICKSPRMAGANRIIDVGTGAGFPGIPLAIVYPDKQFTLMDSLGKRMKILSTLSQEMGLKNVEIIHARAEELAKRKEYRQRYDLCVSRAVANLAVLCEYCLPFVKVGGWFAPYKTAAAWEEIAAAGKAIEILGGRLVDSLSFEEALEALDVELKDRGQSLDHVILWIEKEKNTLSKYPRKAGMPAKEPLK